MAETDGLEASFSEVRASSTRVMNGEQPAKDQSLKDIFRLNNEIGRLARLHPEKREHLKVLQGDVNMITVGVKHDRREDIREGLALTEKAITELAKEGASR